MYVYTYCKFDCDIKTKHINETGIHLGVQFQFWVGVFFSRVLGEPKPMEAARTAKTNACANYINPAPPRCIPYPLVMTNTMANIANIAVENHHVWMESSRTFDWALFNGKLLTWPTVSWQISHVILWFSPSFSLWSSTLPTVKQKSLHKKSPKIHISTFCMNSMNALETQKITRNQDKARKFMDVGHWPLTCWRLGGICWKAQEENIHGAFWWRTWQLD